MPTPQDLNAIAAEIIAKADAAHPADAVLRETLARKGNLDAEAARFITDSVFIYYRWVQWFPPGKSIAEQVRIAYELQQRFDGDPASFNDENLMEKIVPDWTASQVSVSAEWVRSLQPKPLLWLRAKEGQGKHVASRLHHCMTLPALSTALNYRGSADLFRSPEFHAGEFELQDLSSQIVGHVCAPAPNQTWWDACAGEGGKLLHLSDLMQNKGLIWASDRAAWRLQKLKKRAARAKAFNYRAAPWNGGPKLPTKTKFDGVLVDAPCSGVGTWQRNPHARWTTTLKDVLELKELQVQLLLNAAPSLKPGGKLIYSVCTLTRAETSEVAAEVGKSLLEFSPLPLRNPLTGVEASELWLWPQEFGGNGMFIAGWQRKQ
jgi:16S rRNA (cytosine967-C5)-methyltransferase